MKIPELVFVGIGGSVVAMNRATGEKVWHTRLKGSDFVNVLLDRDQLYATTRSLAMAVGKTR
ncbi:MAG: PQQ-binding-like beta-propeller repeat protein [Verrucomicrobia bacterium]|nr:PQQ-binding-like beta-propeller repeat protein [Verrucomicrobiota bacterium]